MNHWAQKNNIVSSPLSTTLSSFVQNSRYSTHSSLVFYITSFDATVPLGCKMDNHCMSDERCTTKPKKSRLHTSYMAAGTEKSILVL